MSYLGHLAARAHNYGASRLVTPKGRGMAARAVEEDEPAEEVSEPAAPAAQRELVSRSTSQTMRHEPRSEDEPAASALPKSSSAPAESSDEPEDVARLADEQEVPGEDAQADQADGYYVSDAEPVHRDEAPALTDEQPDEVTDPPPETANVKVPGQVLAARRAPTAVAAGKPATPGSAPSPEVGPSAIADSSASDAAIESGWIADDATAEAGSGEPQYAPPAPAAPAWSPGPSSLAAPTPSGVVIEQIDVFVTEAAPRTPTRPRLSDPDRVASARYLGGL